MRKVEAKRPVDLVNGGGLPREQLQPRIENVPGTDVGTLKSRGAPSLLFGSAALAPAQDV